MFLNLQILRFWKIAINWIHFLSDFTEKKKKKVDITNVWIWRNGHTGEYGPLVGEGARQSDVLPLKAANRSSPESCLPLVAARRLPQRTPPPQQAGPFTVLLICLSFFSFSFHFSFMFPSFLFFVSFYF